MSLSLYRQFYSTSVHCRCSTGLDDYRHWKNKGSPKEPCGMHVLTSTACGPTSSVSTQRLALRAHINDPHKEKPVPLLRGKTSHTFFWYTAVTIWAHCFVLSEGPSCSLISLSCVQCQITAKWSTRGYCRNRQNATYTLRLRRMYSRKKRPGVKMLH